MSDETRPDDDCDNAAPTRLVYSRCPQSVNAENSAGGALTMTRSSRLTALYVNTKNKRI